MPQLLQYQVWLNTADGAILNFQGHYFTVDSNGTLFIYDVRLPTTNGVGILCAFIASDWLRIVYAGVA